MSPRAPAAVDGPRGAGDHRADDLVRLLPDDVTERLPHWAVIRSESWRRPAVAAVVQALAEEMTRQRERMLGL
jgi:DNA-binding transcriptional LysR family regulator